MFNLILKFTAMSKVINTRLLKFRTGIGLVRMYRYVYYCYVEYDVFFFDDVDPSVSRFRLYKNGLCLARLDDIMLHIVLNRFYLNHD